MSATVRFCSKCGTELVEGARFCASCGAAVVAVSAPVAAPVPPPQTAPVTLPVAPAPPPAAPAPVSYPPPQSVAAAAVPTSAGDAEQVRSVIANVTLKAGFMGVKSKQYTLVLTDRRVVFAQITMAMMSQLVTEARDGAKAEGKGFFGQWGAQLSSYSAFAARYLEMPPAEALAETADNFAIDRSTITKTSLKTGHTYDDSSATTDRLIIKTAGNKYDITLGSGVSQAKQALTAAHMI